MLDLQMRFELPGSCRFECVQASGKLHHPAVSSSWAAPETLDLQMRFELPGSYV
jgi:hypothetical protein